MKLTLLVYPITWQATGSALSTALNAVTAMILSLTIAFIFGWKLSLVSLAFVPFLIGTGYAQAKLLVGFAAQSMDVVEEGGKVGYIPWCSMH